MDTFLLNVSAIFMVHYYSINVKKSMYIHWADNQKSTDYVTEYRHGALWKIKEEDGSPCS